MASEIKALEKLRVSKDASDYQWIRSDYLNQIADAIEAEISEHYMRLPCDADGVPIHVGDKMIISDRHIGIVTAVGKHNEERAWILQAGKNVSICYIVSKLKHVKQRTLEDVLIDAMQFGFSSQAGDDVMDKAREFADEIRELLKEGGND